MNDALILALAANGGGGGGGSAGLPTVKFSSTFDDGTTSNPSARFLSFENDADFDRYVPLGVPLLTDEGNRTRFVVISYDTLNNRLNTVYLFHYEDIVIFANPSIQEHDGKRYIQLSNYGHATQRKYGSAIYSLPAWPSPDDNNARRNYYLGFGANGNMGWLPPAVLVVDFGDSVATTWAALALAAIGNAGSTVGSEGYFTQAFPNAYATLLSAMGPTLIRGGSCWLQVGDTQMSVVSANNVDLTALLSYTLIDTGNTYLMNVAVNANSVTFCAKLIATA